LTDDPVVIEGEITETTTTDLPDRPFVVVSHKNPLAGMFAQYGAEQDFGATVNPDTAPLTLWWTSQDWASQVLAAGVGLPQLLAPSAGFVARLDPKWLQRQVGHLRKRDIPAFYAKHPGQVSEHPQVILSSGAEHTELRPPVMASSADLAAGTFPGSYGGLPGDVLLQLDQPLNCVTEVRYWVTNGELTAVCPYRLGVVGWDSSLFLEMLFNSQGRELIGEADRVAHEIVREVDGPPGYAIDLGVTPDGTVTVLRVWPSWSAEPFSADPTGVLRSLLASHDFDQRTELDVWRWGPDLRLYDRGRPVPGDDDPRKESDGA
jgi:hypothetical protein